MFNCSLCPTLVPLPLRVFLQADSGAQAIQIFDSWASELMPQDFDVFSGPYIKKVINSFKCVQEPGGLKHSNQQHTRNI